MSRPLTPKQERFAQLYVELGNASEAYRGAYSCKGMSDRAIQVEASKLLRHPAIALRIKELSAKAASKHEITAERVMAELAKIAFADLADFLEIDENGEVRIDFVSASAKGSLAALSEITQDEYMEGHGDDARPVKKTKFKLHSKDRSLELIGKRLMMWVERHSHEGPALQEVFSLLPADLRARVIETIEARQGAGA